MAAERLIHHLIEDGTFGHPTSAIEIVETHISWVLLTGEYAYKIKKPVDLGFLDFSTLDARHRYCLLELELNRRFAPGLYQAVVSIGGQPERPVIGALPALEWAVRMRQFPGDARLDRQIEQGLVSTDAMWEFGESLARLHDRSDVWNVTDGSHDPVSDISGPAIDNFTALGAHCADRMLRKRLDALSEWSAHELVRLAPTIRDRQATGRIRDCHGDLHLENLVRLAGRIVPFDCIEFDAVLRRIDVMNEVAFLLMDTVRIERQDLGYSFLNRYLEVTGDYPGIAMLPFYCVYRCLVRAKVAALRNTRTNTLQADILRYVGLAERFADRDREPALVICRGVSGAGKTHLSRRLLSAMPAIRLRSDIVRKQLRHVDELASSGSAVGEGLYDPDMTATTYQKLAQFSALALQAGYDVIVDATFLCRADRAMLQSVAENHSAGFAILDCTADERVLAARIESRQAAGGDASEANLAVLRWQSAHLEPLTVSEQHHALAIDTGHDTAVDDILQRLHECLKNTRQHAKVDPDATNG